jgi:hypothetical protein
MAPEAAKESEPGDAYPKGEQPQGGGQGDTAAQPGGHAPQLQVEMHGRIVPQTKRGVDGAMPWRTNKRRSGDPIPFSRQAPARATAYPLVARPQSAPHRALYLNCHLTY